MPELMQFSSDDTRSFLAILPEILMTILLLIVIYMDLFLPASRRKSVGYMAGIGMLVIGGLSWLLVPSDGLKVSEQLILGGMVRSDDLAKIFTVMVTLVGGLTCMMGMGDSRLRYKGEFYALIIIATMGASLLSSAADLVMIFISLETLSITLYVLSGFVRRPETPDATQEAFATRSAESGMKYFLFGAFTSAFLLYGLSLLYGFSGGHTNIYRIGEALASGRQDDAPIIVALMLVAVGFGFKISAVPFHFWTPDVYEGSPTPVTSFISVVSKAASFAVLTRFLLAVFPPAELVTVHIKNYSEIWVQLLSILAVITMTLGNVVALSQRNIKRLIAYSSIAQAGYTLMGVAAIATTKSGDGAAAVAYYMFMYVFTNTLFFACLILFTNATGSETIADMAGLSRRNPWLAMGITIALLSLAGIPPAAGFIGKFLLFRAAVDAGLTWLAVIGVLNAIIALYYYLVVIKVMYVDRSADDEKPIAVPAPYGFVMAASAVAILLLGTFLISPVVDWATQAGLDLFRL
ncbi:MAG: NADH-quinone oxidoreductase subunit N [Chloroflexi bacterium]|nr:NADH-quinone oxidoreductase subunit N [Chloroflexota bacterium]